MYTPVYARQFERDLKLAVRRGKNIEKFKIVARTLLAGEVLDPIHRDHRLVGNYTGRRDCHIESDWLLIYKRHLQNLCRKRPRQSVALQEAERTGFYALEGRALSRPPEVLQVPHKADGDRLVFERMGTHSDLFKRRRKQAPGSTPSP